MGAGITLMVSNLISRSAQSIGTEVTLPVQRSLYRNKGHRDGIDTVANILRCQAFTFEHMAKMAVAFRTQYLDTMTIGVDLPLNCTLNLIVKSRPAAIRMKFVFGAIQGCIALFADVMTTGFEVISQWTGKRHFGAFMKQNVLFFRGQFVVIGHKHYLLVMCGVFYQSWMRPCKLKFDCASLGFAKFKEKAS
jgi:hypothetical protein